MDNDLLEKRILELEKRVLHLEKVNKRKMIFTVVGFIIYVLLFILLFYLINKFYGSLLNDEVLSMFYVFSK